MHTQNAPRTAPKILSPESVKRIKDAMLAACKTGRSVHKRFLAMRDYTIFSIALDTGLREHEVAALTVSDVFEPSQRAKGWALIRVYKGHKRVAKPAKATDGTPRKTASKAKPREPQRVFLPEPTREALERFFIEKHRNRESLAPDAPLFAGRAGKPLSLRSLRHVFEQWQARAGLEPHHFHIIRHTAITRYWRNCRDLRATQVFARHASPTTTVIYTHVEDSYLERIAESAAVA